MDCTRYTWQVHLFLYQTFTLNAYCYAHSISKHRRGNPSFPYRNIIIDLSSCKNIFNIIFNFAGESHKQQCKVA